LSPAGTFHICLLKKEMAPAAHLLEAAKVANSFCLRFSLPPTPDSKFTLEAQSFASAEVTEAYRPLPMDWETKHLGLFDATHSY